MADAAVEFLLDNLRQLLLYHGNIIFDAQDQVEQLKEDLLHFKAFLKDSSKKRRSNDSVRELISKIRVVVYEVEDVIDAFVTQSTESRSKNTFSRIISKQNPVKLHIVVKEVENIKSRLRDIILFDSLNDGDGGPEESEEYNLKQAPRISQKNVVGFEDERSEIIRYLTERTEKPDVITLVGMPGIGKTTLAWKIFDDPDIRYEFPTRIWVHVSDEFTMKDVMLTILRQLSSISDQHVEDRGERDLYELVRSHLEHTKFLIVLDDVRSVSDWNEIRQIVEPKSESRGKVLITSCNEEVGAYVHRVRFLTASESWELLRLEVFGETTKCPPELETVGNIIAQQCDGLPLAIITMADILVKEDLSCADMTARKTAWTKACQSVPKYRNKNFYNSLPDRLQQCFLYLAAFPDDFEIPVGKLIKMWIAEGFVEKVDGGCSLEETAENYVKNLISRSLLRVQQMKDDGRVKTCRIHSMLREFCQTEAGEQRENIVTEIKMSRDGDFNSNLSQALKFRRVSVHSNVSRFLSSKPFGPHTRSFLCFSQDETSLTEKHNSTIPAAFKLLRVLDVKPIKFVKLPRDFYNLVHLRYLALSLGHHVLPSTFVKLWNIQTLQVDTTARWLDIKVDIFEFTQLRHFKTNAQANLRKPGKRSEGGKELQSLGMIAPESCTETVLDKAPNLKKLGIRGKLILFLEENNRSLECLSKLNHLENLKLVNDVFPLQASDGRLDSLPPAYKFPTSLKSLTLVATYLDWSQMTILAGLPNLEVLKLEDNAFMGRIWGTDGSFERLKALRIGRTDLTIWAASANQFPRLESLKLHYCEKLEGVPIELADIPSFQTLDLFMTKIASASAKRFIGKTGFKEFKLSIYPQVQYE